MDVDPLAGLAGLEGVASAFAGARDGMDAVLRDRGLRRTTPADTAASLLAGAEASAVLAGDEGGDETQTAERDAVRVSGELLALAPLLSGTPLQALARIHSLAAGGLPAHRRGRPESADAAARLQELGRLLRTPGTTPALLVAAVAHAELATAAPFGSHPGIVARAAERLVLVARGVDPASVTVPEAGHLSLRAAYRSNLRGYASGGTPGVQAWLLYAAEAYAAGADLSPIVR